MIRLFICLFCGLGAIFPVLWGNTAGRSLPLITEVYLQISEFFLARPLPVINRVFPYFSPGGIATRHPEQEFVQDENSPSIMEGHERGATLFYRRSRDLWDGRPDLFGDARQKRESTQIFLLSGDCAGGLAA